MNIREFYLENFPTDEFGLQISETATFGGLLRQLFVGEDVYQYMGVSCNLVRERVFWKLAALMRVKYDYVYDLWLNALK
jgi:hypothetical protein